MTPGEWAQLLYGDAAGPLSVFAKSTSGATRVVWTSPDAIDADVASLDGDVWLGCATRRERLAAGRGGDADCLEVPGLWLDVDVAGPHHAAANLPATIAEAAELIRSFPLRPTAVIDSGGGLQAWWLFAELVDAADAKPVLDRWAATWKELGRRRGWHVDNVFDLARIMRLPGTANHKSDPPRPVEVTFIRPDRRYGLDDFEPHMLEASPATVIEREPYVGPARAGDRYNAVTDPGSVLLGHGCVFDHDAGGERHYRAPHHAADTTTGVVVYPDGHTTIYSETWAQVTGLKVRRPYDAFGLRTVLEHRGDYEASARSLDPTFGELPHVVDAEASPDAEVADATESGTSWEPVDLAAVLSGEIRTTPPSILQRTDGHHLVYPARIHWVSGDPESGKSWFTYAAAVELVQNGKQVVVIDFEDTAANAVERFRSLGLEDAQIVEHVRFIAPYEKLEGPAMAGLRATVADAALLIVDACSEAMSLAGLDPYNNPDTVKWVDGFVKPLARIGPAVLVIDHMPKSKESGRRFMLGAGFKLAAVDGAAYTLDVIEPFARGVSGKVKVTIAKDRPGHVRAHSVGTRTAAEMFVTAAPNGTVSLALHPSAGKTRPTGIMEKVSKYLEARGESVTVTAARDAIGGNTTYFTTALGLLTAEGFVTSVEGPRRARMLTHVRPFVEVVDLVRQAVDDGEDDVQIDDLATALGAEVVEEWVGND